MPVKTPIPFDYGHFFMTFTCYQWLPLIKVTDSYNEVYTWFEYLHQQRHHITGYVIMPNHVHVSIAFVRTSKSINRIVGDGKRFIGYGIINRLKKIQRQDILSRLSEGVKDSDRKKGQQYMVWENSFDWKYCESDEFAWQKISYMHQNPCSGKWSLASEPVLYPHSSARYYLLGEIGEVPILNFKSLHDFSW